MASVNQLPYVMTNRYPHGTRVIVRTKDGRKVNGTVRWAGELPLEGEDPKKKIPVYGVETVSFLMTVYLNNYFLQLTFNR